MDIDGCLADVTKAVKECNITAEKRSERDFDCFDRLIPEAKLQLWCKYLNNQMFDLCEVVILTAREERDRSREDTVEWLNRKGIQYNRLIMRDFKDGRSSSDVKREKLKEIKKEYQILFAVDDSPEINIMYKEEGILCLRPNIHNYSS